MPTSRRLPLVLLGLSLLVSGVFAPVSALGQSDGGRTESIIDSLADPRFEKGAKPTEADMRVLEDSGVAPVNLELNWRFWSRSLEDQPNVAKLRQLRSDAVSVGRPNLPDYALALANQAHDGKIPASEASTSFEHAVDLAPDLPQPHLAHAWYLLGNDPGQFATAASRFSKGISQGLRWPETRTAWALSLSLLALLAVVIALTAFSLGQILRQFGIASRDLMRLLPKFVSRNQVLVLVLVAAVATGIWLNSPLVAALLLLGFASVPQRPTERAVTALVALVLLMLPTLDRAMVPWANFHGSQAQTLMRAQYFGCDEGCRKDLEKSADSPPGDTRVYTLALAEIRTGEQPRIEKAVERLDTHDFETELAAWADNLRGAGLVAAGRPEVAESLLKSAESSLSDSPAPPYNLGRAYQQQGNPAKARDALSRATSRDLAAVRHKTDLKRRDAPSFLMLPSLPTDHFLQKARRDASTTAGMIATWWAPAAGPRVPLSKAPWLGAALLSILLLGLPLQMLGLTSTPCPRCGLAREPSDPKHTGGEPHCLPCYRTSVGAANLDYRDRVHYESYLGRRESILDYLRLGMTALAPGTGHSMAGHALTGFTLSLSAALAAVALFVPMVLQSPESLFWQDWLGLRVLGGALAAVVLLVVLLTLRSGIEPWSVDANSSSRPSTRGHEHD